MTCRTCDTALDLLAEISVAIRELPSEKQVEFRADVMRQHAPPSRSN
jgi:hypothetical protein